MLQRPRSSSLEKSRIPISKKRSSSTSRSDLHDGPRFSNIQPKQSLASASRHQGSIGNSASIQRDRRIQEPSTETRGRILKEHGCPKDTRPIADKAFQEKAKQELSRFLTEHNVPDKVHRNPRDEYKTIIDLLCSSLGMPDGYSLGSKVQDSMPHLLHMLDYPRSNLNPNFYQTIGAMHTWPSLLAIMDWLRTAAELNYDIYEDILEDIPYVNREFIKHDLKCYLLFLNGKDDFADESAKLAKIIGNDRNLSKENCEIKAQVSEMEDKLKKLEATAELQQNNCRKLEKNSKTLLEGINKLYEIETSLGRQNDSVTKEIEQLKNQLGSIESNCNSLAKDVEGYEAKVKDQEQQGYTVQKLQSEYSNAKKQNTLLKSEINNLEELIKSNQAISSKTTEKIREVVLKLQQSLDFTSLLTQEEEQIIFGLTLVIGEEPQKAKSIMKILDRITCKLNGERRKLDETLEQDNLHKLKQDLSKSENEVSNCNDTKKSLEREAEIIEEMFEKEFQELNDIFKVAKDSCDRTSNVLHTTGNRIKLSLNEVASLELKNNQERQACLGMIRNMGRMERQLGSNVKKIIESCEKVVQEDILIIKSEVAKEAARESD